MYIVHIMRSNAHKYLKEEFHIDTYEYAKSAWLHWEGECCHTSIDLEIIAYNLTLKILATVSLMCKNHD